MENTTIKYSLIIATYNRLPELKELIASVTELDFPKAKFELLISDDGSTDGTEAFVKAQDFSFNFKYIKQENKGPGEARNHGMREANGEFFIFIDSDCIIPANYLQEVDKAVLAEQLEAFGGPDDCHPDFPPMLKAINYSMTSFIGTGGTRGGSKKAVTKFYPRSYNMGIHRKVFEDVGGMNKLRHGQDMDLSVRIYNAGYKVGLIQDAFVYHKRRTNLRRFYKQIFNWGVARINLGRMYDSMLKPIHLAPAVIVAGLILVAVLALFFTWGRYLFGLAVLGALGIAGLAFLQSYARYKSVKVSLLSIITLYTQVFAYGAGTWSGIFQALTGKKVAKGFSKNYYK